jgi:hypothetical protein
VASELDTVSGLEVSSREVVEGELLEGAKNYDKRAVMALPSAVIQGGGTVVVSQQFTCFARDLRLIIVDNKDFDVNAIHIGYRAQFDGPPIPSELFAETLVIPAVSIPDVVKPGMLFSVTVRNRNAASREFRGAVLYELIEEDG